MLQGWREEEAGEVDVDVEEEARGRRAVGDAIPIRIGRKKKIHQHLV